jgi:hypothetical protein
MPRRPSTRQHAAAQNEGDEGREPQVGGGSVMTSRKIRQILAEEEERDTELMDDSDDDDDEGSKEKEATSSGGGTEERRGTAEVTKDNGAVSQQSSAAYTPTHTDELSQITEETQGTTLQDSGSISINWTKAGAGGSGRYGRDSILLKSLTFYVKGAMFRRVKFIDLDDPKLANTLVPECMSHLGVDDRKLRDSLINRFKRVIMYSISQQRNRAAQNVGKTVKSGK